MLTKKFKEAFKLVFYHKETVRFSVLAILGLAFSLAVVLATIGLMDGFVTTLKTNLHKSNGDLTLTHRRGFFRLDETLRAHFKYVGVEQLSEIIQTESFLIKSYLDTEEKEAKGVLAKGIDKLDYGKVVGMDFTFGGGEIAIGSELAKMMDLKIGDEVVLAIAKGNQEVSSLPQLVTKKIGQIVTHGVYQKDLRIVYFNKSDLQQLIDVGGKINQISFNLEKSQSDTNYIQSFLPVLRNEFGDDYILKPFWREFGSLIEAVQTEKIMIGLILQIIVFISIFNFLAFILYVNERRARDFFLLSALGMARTDLVKIWYMATALLWFLAVIISLIFVQFMRVLILKLSLSILPADVYFLQSFDFRINVKEYFLVYVLSFLWVMSMSFFVIRKVKKKPLLEGLRQEFA